MATAHADEASDKAAITERLQRWTADFNSSDAVGVCDLFAPDLIYSIPVKRRRRGMPAPFPFSQ